VQNPGITAGEILFGDSIESALQTSPGSIVDNTSFSPKLIDSRLKVQGSRFKGYNCLKLHTKPIKFRYTQLHPLGEKALLTHES
jgi:hypothetical protein